MVGRAIAKVRKRWAVAIAVILLLGINGRGFGGLGTQGLGTQGLGTQGLGTQGLGTQGLGTQGLGTQGLGTQGLGTQGLGTQGLGTQGLGTQGLGTQGLGTQGLGTQGVGAQALALFGSDLPSAEPRGFSVDHVVMRGKSALDPTNYPAELTPLPGLSAGAGNYISVAVTGGSESAVGHYAIAKMADENGVLVPDPTTCATPPCGNPSDLDLYIAGEMRDPIPNVFHRSDEQDNEDMLYTMFMFHKPSGQWVSACPYDARTKSATVMAIAEDPTQPEKFILACTASGVSAKCARNWGFRPWDTTKTWAFDKDENALVERSVPLLAYYKACVVAARAAYCQDEKSFTKNGTEVDLFDTSQIIWANSVENPFNAANQDSRWMMAQEYFVSTSPRISCTSASDCATGAECKAGRCVDIGGDGFTCSQPFDCGSAANVAAANAANGPLRSALQRTRYRELSPQGTQCGEYPSIDRLEHDHIEDGRWGVTPDRPDLHVFSPLSCRHNEQEVGEALPWDCSPCTTQVCRDMPHCCGRGGTWDSDCVTKSLTTPACLGEDSNPVPGLVWPRDLTPGTDVTRQKYLIGAGGAVLRVDGVGPAATISGWACDPEWPTSTVMVELYGNAPREQPGSVLLGRVRADQELASPLSHEVARACDGPYDVAFHGFKLALDNWSGIGNVFAYAIDEATADGPAAPPTLLRNGIVHVPTDAPPPVASAFTVVATGWIEAPLDGSYGFKADAQPSRLWINGQLILGWGPWPTSQGDAVPNTTTGQITLMKGTRYHIRWDRLQTEPPPDGTSLLLWSPPVGGNQPFVPVPQSNLYQVAPGSGLGLSATYNDFCNGNVQSGVTQRLDPFVDINPQPAPPAEQRFRLPVGPQCGTEDAPIPASPYDATWDGEIVPPVSGDYTFHVISSASGVDPSLPLPTLTIGNTAVSLDQPPAPSPSSSCVQPENGGHSVCDIGRQLNALCDDCAGNVCATDPFCCNGGNSTYYSTEPVWDGKCVAEAAQLCGLGCRVPNPDSALDYKFVKVTLRAGVHYPVHLYIYTANFFGKPDGSDSTAQFLWEGAGILKQLVPQFALYPRDQAPLAKGSGLNVTYFATKTDPNPANPGAVVPDFDTPLAAGATPTVSSSPVAGELGTPLYDVLASSSTPPDPVNGAPLPLPNVAPLTYGAEFVSSSSGAVTPVTMTGMGVAGSLVALVLDTRFLNLSDGARTALEASLAFASTTVASNGTFSATIDVPNVYGTWVVRLSQAPPSGAPVATTKSPERLWPFLLVKSTRLPGAIEIDAPRDLTYSPVATENKFAVSGRGVPSNPVSVTDLGSGGSATLTPADLTAGADGAFQGTVELSVGWHKLVFHQDGAQSNIAFVAVGLQPPIVDFPRTAAELGTTLGCLPRQGGTEGSGQPPPVLDGWNGDITGTTAYPPDQFGKIYIGEETGRAAMKRSFTPNSVVPTLGADGLYHYTFSFADPSAPTALGPGKHVLYVFQAPDPPASATRAEVEAHFRGFASIAAATKLVLSVSPLRFGIQGGVARDSCGSIASGTGDPPLPCWKDLLPGLTVTDGTSSPLLQNFTTYDHSVKPPLETCTGTPDPSRPFCAQPFADVNLKVGSRTFTARADEHGNWTLEDVDKPAPGWTTLAFSQVVPSDVGGTWSTSCPTPPIDISITQGAPLVIGVPSTITTPATSRAGAVVTYSVVPPWTHATFRDSLSCTPESGATFPLGTTHVLCTAIERGDPAVLGGGPGTPDRIGTATFDVIVTRSEPTIHFPASLDADAGGVTHLEATSSLGAEVSYDVTATDIFDGAVDVTCAPSSPALFPFGNSGLTCTATNSAGIMFTDGRAVLVQDTTAPTLTLPAPVTVTAVGTGGTVVTFTATASDIVSGPVPVTCTPPSGSTFPVGVTTVTCSASDGAGNPARGGFTVTVLPPINTPPVVTVPANMTVETTSATGATVTFTATATDKEDGPLTPACTPASGSTFALGTKPVTCTVTDTGGLPGSASFTVTVTDSKGPTFSDVPGTVKAYATSTAGARVTYALPHANDAVDGARPVTCTPSSGSQFPVNKTTVTCSASDTRGNTSTATFTVWVTYQAPTDGTFFLFPTRSDGNSLFRIGRPVPVRFRLTGASAAITNLVAKLTVTKLSSTVQGTILDASDETVDDTDFLFKYRPLLRWYAYRWKTRDQTQGTFQLKADLGDGVGHQVNVSLKP